MARIRGQQPQVLEVAGKVLEVAGKVLEVARKVLPITMNISYQERF